MDGGAWKAAVHGVAESWTRLTDFTFTFHFHASEKEMATHSSVLAWRIPGTGELHGLPSMGSHRVGHDWSDLAAAAAACPLSQCCHLTISSSVVYWVSYRVIRSSISLLIFCLVVLLIIEWGTEIFNSNCWIVCFFFSIVSLLHVFWGPVLRCAIFKSSSWCSNCFS